MPERLFRPTPRAIVLSAVTILCLAVAGVLILANNFDPCETIVHDTISAPANTRAMIVFERACGASVGFNTQVSLAPVKRIFSPQRTPAFLVPSGRHALSIRWIGPTLVHVDVPRAATIIKSDDRVDDVRVEYR